MKDCKIIFCNKQTYEFNSQDLAKALEFVKDKNVWAIKTPWCVLTLMNEEEFDNVSTCVFDGPADNGEQDDDLIV